MASRGDASVSGLSTAALEAALAEARTLYRAVKLQDAEQLCRVVLKQAPNHPGALHQLAEIMLRAGVPVLALALALRAAAHEPASAEVLHTQGKIYQALGRLAEAETALRQALELEPGHPRRQATL